MFWLGFFHLSESFFRGELFLALIKSVSLPMKNPHKFGPLILAKLANTMFMCHESGGTAIKHRSQSFLVSIHPT
jgi:hypothetical protein